MQRGLPILLGLALITSPARAQEPGDWTGTLAVSDTVRLRLDIRIRAGADGKLQGAMVSIDQGSPPIPLADIIVAAEVMSFTVPAIAGKYEAKWDAAARRWKGSWTQGGMPLPLELTAGNIMPPPPPPTPLPENWSIPADADIAKMIDTRIAGRPGEAIVIGVVEPGGRRFVARGNGATATAKTLYEIGSMTKVFTALLLADMVQRGEVKLDDPVETYLPAGAKMPERSGRKITLADLATHRSGLPRLPDNMPFGDPTNPYADYSEAMLLTFLGRYQLPRDIGSLYEYSNLGGGLLGYVLARRAGVDYETLVKRRITGPLGMHDTTITLSADQKKRFIQGHDGALKPARSWDLPTLAGAGGLRSTADDMLTFLTAAMGAKPTPLAPAFTAMLAQQWPGVQAGIDTGLGWMIIKSRTGDLVWHGGGTGGYRTTMIYDPAKKRGVVVLTNAAAEPSADDLGRHLMMGAPVAATPPPAAVK